MGLTSRFKFHFFGGTTPGTINDDGQAFTGIDRVRLDRLLAAVESHDHHFRAPVGVAAEVPTLNLLSGAGTLQGGYSYSYRFAVVDADGNESIASAEASVTTPALLAIPGMPSLSSDQLAGSLTPGIYYYGLTALRGSEETPLGAAALIGLQAGDTEVTLELPAYGDADSLRVWRMGTTEPGYTQIGLVPAGTATFVDNGSVPADPCACDPGNAPPQMNKGTATYAVDVTLPIDVDLTAARSWRLYRTVYPGIYPTTSLVHEVVEREAEWDPTTALLRVWRDTGAPMALGQPMDTDLNMRFQALTFEVLAALPDPAPYPPGYPLLVSGELYAKVAGAWAPVGGSGAGGMSPIMTDPTGARYLLSVDGAGALVTTPTVFPGPPAIPSNPRW